MEKIEINCTVSDFVHYNDRLKSPIKRLYVRNLGDEDIQNVSIVISTSPQFASPVTIELDKLPRKATINFDAKLEMSPLFLISASNMITAEVNITVLSGKNVVGTSAASTNILGYEECNIDFPASLCHHVTNSATVVSLVKQVNAQLDKWGKVSAIDIEKSGKNDIRFVCAAIYSVVAKLDLISQPLDSSIAKITPHKDILSTSVASPLDLALLIAAIAEAKGIFACVGRVRADWFVGFWLKNEYFDDVVVDDISMVSKRCASGVSDMTIIGVKYLLDGLSYESNEKKSENDIKLEDKHSYFVDIYRGRLTKIRPQPERVRSENGYDLVENEYDTDKAPTKIKLYKADVGIGINDNRESQWERRLLDLSMKNNLVNFHSLATAIHILSGQTEDFLSGLDLEKGYALSPLPQEVGTLASMPSFGGGSHVKPLTEYIKLESKNNKIHTFLKEKELGDAVKAIYRKEKVFLEESGACSLYLAVGFLKWQDAGTQAFMYAPLILYPINLLVKSGEKAKYEVKFDGEDIRINNTLLEFVYREFNIDMRGLSNVKLDSVTNIMSIIARIKKEIVGAKGWDITDDVYLSSFSFSSYLMWKDVRTKFNIFAESNVIASLMKNESKFSSADKKMSDGSADGAYGSSTRNAAESESTAMSQVNESYGKSVYLPISADSSQYSAVVDSLSKSFVLHGPPGTGKSQTITNIIASNIAQGRRVLFVAEKMAALSVVKKRLDSIGIGDFCREIHSNKINKTELLADILKTMSLAGMTDYDIEGKSAEIRELIAAIQEKMNALHRVRHLGFSIYEAIIRYLSDEDAPNGLRIDPIFYEKLSQSSLVCYENLLSNLVSCASECGEIPKSPFRRIGSFDYSAKWRVQADYSILILKTYIDNLKVISKSLMSLLKVRTLSLTTAKLEAMYELCHSFMSEKYAAIYFGKVTEDSYQSLVTYANARNKFLSQKQIYDADYMSELDDLDLSLLVSDFDGKRKYSMKVFKRLERISKKPLDKSKLEHTISMFIAYKTSYRNYAERMTALAEKFDLDKDFDEVTAFAHNVIAIYEQAAIIYSDENRGLLEKVCADIAANHPMLILSAYIDSYNMFSSARSEFARLFDYRVAIGSSEDIGDFYAYIKLLGENLDMVPNWCAYNRCVTECRDLGLDFIVNPLSSGSLSAHDILRSFRKSVYGNFVSSEIALDVNLCEFSGKNIESKIDKLKGLMDEYEQLTRKEIYYKLVGQLPRADMEGGHNLEMVLLQRAEKNGMRGTTLRRLFEQAPSIIKAACPCLLMSPYTVSQYLNIESEKFDLVIFDEASQMPTCEAIGAIARAKDVIVVGDPQQLPPSSYFASDYKDADKAEFEDLESILDDCLAIGMPSRHLLWHYRSHHESLIAFSNAMYYDNKLYTFPSASELDSKVSLRYVNGIYDRGGKKHNKIEAEELVREVVERLKSPTARLQSIGIVTFNTSQQEYIDDLLSTAIYENKLEKFAYDVEEPIFVKNLENVQGDERDVILFAVGFGPDNQGKLSYNFGPLNRNGGYRRLNVAVTRARTEMLVFSSMTANMIDLSKTDSKGVKGLKAFLEYAEKGREMLAIDSRNIAKKSTSIGKIVADNLREFGLECEYDVGVSNFKIDVAVIDPRDRTKYLLAIFTDGMNAQNIVSVRDRVVMYSKLMKQLGWNTYYLWTVNFVSNAKREVSKIREYIANLTKEKEVSKKSIKESLLKFRRKYRVASAKLQPKAGVDYVLSESNAYQILTRANAIIEVEQPIEESSLADKLCVIFGITKQNKKAYQQLCAVMRTNTSKLEQFEDKYFYRDPSTAVDGFRPNDTAVTRDLCAVHPSEIIVAIKCALSLSPNVTAEELQKEVTNIFAITKKNKFAGQWFEYCLNIAATSGAIIKTLDGHYKI